MSTTKVLLTGGNGFIAINIIVSLLQRGYSVTTTVRSESKSTYLRQKFSEAVGEERLKFLIVEDITLPGAFDKALMGDSFDAVIHTSSPVTFEAHDVKKDILLPAIQGTTELLKSTKAYGHTVKRVVVTSSIVAIVDLSKGNRPGYAYSEKDWNPLTFEQSQQNAHFGYAGSKIYAEKAAWEFIDIEKPQFDLVTICPPMVYGPAFQEVTSMSNLNLTSKKFYSIFNGEAKQPTNDIFWQWADVRDVAEAHVAAIEKPDASGQRFFITAGEFNIAQVVDYIWRYFPERALAKGIPKATSSMGYPEAGYYTGNNAASKRVLGIQYRLFEEMLKDQLDQYVALEKQFEVQA